MKKTMEKKVKKVKKVRKVSLLVVKRKTALTLIQSLRRKLIGLKNSSYALTDLKALEDLVKSL